MYVDSELLFEEDWDLDGSANTYFAENAIDLSVAARDVGKGRQMYVVIVVTEEFTCGNSGTSTVTFSLVEEDTESDGTVTLNSSPILLSTEAFADSVLTLGRAPIVIPVPSSIVLQYLGLKAVTTVELTAGMVTAFLTTEVQTNY